MTRKRSELADPWEHARLALRAYITPEDITAAVEAGAYHGGLHRTVLKAIADGKAEDYRLCAFVAARAGERQGVARDE